VDGQASKVNGKSGIGLTAHHSSSWLLVAVVRREAASPENCARWEGASGKIPSGRAIRISSGGRARSGGFTEAISAKQDLFSSRTGALPG